MLGTNTWPGLLFFFTHIRPLEGNSNFKGFMSGLLLKLMQNTGPFYEERISRFYQFFIGVSSHKELWVTVLRKQHTTAYFFLKCNLEIKYRKQVEMTKLTNYVRLSRNWCKYSKLKSVINLTYLKSSFLKSSFFWFVIEIHISCRKFWK